VKRETTINGEFLQETRIKISNAILVADFKCSHFCFAKSVQTRGIPKFFPKQFFQNSDKQNA